MTVVRGRIRPAGERAGGGSPVVGGRIRPAGERAGGGSPATSPKRSGVAFSTTRAKDRHGPVARLHPTAGAVTGSEGREETGPAVATPMHPRAPSNPVRARRSRQISQPISCTRQCAPSSGRSPATSRTWWRGTLPLLTKLPTQKRPCARRLPLANSMPEWASSELRAARRLTGRGGYLAMMADSERALGRLDRALALVTGPDAATADRAEQVELRIVESGIRRDMGAFDAAVVVLQIPELAERRLRPWSARLFYAYADALLDAGRTDEAYEWFRRAAAADPDGETDAADRFDELDDVTIEDLEGDADEGDSPHAP